jgi:broad specificity phosphatase PhoE
LSALTPEVTGIKGGRVFDVDARPEGGESLNDVSDRVERFVEETIATHSGARLLIVTHGGTIRALLAYLTHGSIEDFPWITVENCSRWDLDIPFLGA